MAKETDNWFTLKDGLKIFERTWEPVTPPKAHFVILHGFSDHAGRYQDFATLLTSLYPIRVTAWDRRGWGRTVRSETDKGVTGDNKQMFSDMHEYLLHSSTDAPNLPLFVGGHSMGGQELLYYLLSTSSPFYTKKTGAIDPAGPKLTGVVFNAPLVTMTERPPAVVISLGRKTVWLTPNRQFKNDPKTGGLCRDEAAIKSWLEDDLCHDTGTLQGIVSAFDREDEITGLANSNRNDKKGLPKGVKLHTTLPCPVMWGHGTEDGASKFDASEKLCARLDACGDREGDKVFKKYEGWYHSLNSEPGECKEIYARDVGGWIMSLVERGGT